MTVSNVNININLTSSVTRSPLVEAQDEMTGWSPFTCLRCQGCSIYLFLLLLYVTTNTWQVYFSRIYIRSHHIGALSIPITAPAKLIVFWWKRHILITIVTTQWVILFTTNCDILCKFVSFTDHTNFKMATTTRTMRRGVKKDTRMLDYIYGNLYLNVKCLYVCTRLEGDRQQSG